MWHKFQINWMWHKFWINWMWKKIFLFSLHFYLWMPVPKRISNEFFRSPEYQFRFEEANVPVMMIDEVFSLFSMMIYDIASSSGSFVDMTSPQFVCDCTNVIVIDLDAASSQENEKIALLNGIQNIMFRLELSQYLVEVLWVHFYSLNAIFTLKKQSSILGINCKTVTIYPLLTFK